MTERQPPKGWSITSGRLTRTYTFPDFAQALAFTNKVGAAAEAMNHHPDIALGWGKVGIELWTHSVGGLSDKDYALAERIEALG